MKYLFAGLMLCNYMSLQAQESMPLDSIPYYFQKTKEEFNILKRLKIGGYFQTQWQMAETAGMSSFAGGNFAPGVDNRFTVRRGRVRVSYTHSDVNLYMVTDGTEKGVSLKDAVITWNEPWTKSLSLRMGMFYKPFGFEIDYSSSNRESPERGRMSQVIFQGERDLGVSVKFQNLKSKLFKPISLEVSLINGSGNSVSDYDSYKDFLGRLRYSKLKEKNFSFGFGLSYYNGGINPGNKYIYEFTNQPNNRVYQLQDTNSVPTKLTKEYFGIDAQYGFYNLLGQTILRAEYIMGTQPGTINSSASMFVAISNDTYIRDFNGAYFYLIQDILKTKWQVLIKYDWFDPNSKIKAEEIPSNVVPGIEFKSVNLVDAKFSTLGLGINYAATKELKFCFYYELIKNESSQNLTSLKDDQKDNVLTIRSQYKF
ncbi:MAG: OprO/OprP family phosphate-selective porin [Bacteroidota bacterium]|nr:OprO/OprP family phosphate-selective porin [Bacteroidota bacterium]